MDIPLKRIEALFRSLPNVPADQITGNLPKEENQTNANIFAFYLTGRGGPTPIQDPARGGRLEIEVTEQMCNVFGTMHGACAAYLIDHATIGTMVLYGRVAGFDGRGVTTAMNIHWHNAANLGDTLSVSTTSVHVDNRARMVRCEIRDKDTNKLLISGTNSFLNAGAAQVEHPEKSKL
ncbi:4HBT domain-containing protein [Mycena chlorophos]|uniref:4HBT domain-containing protein n=1 Tax=Mycena chlorophos TaxID=658473 RepID=A0A8H6SCJ8_MYCCL|nr:4HBT domain-containing protein [Mycena chlorophos]